MLLIDKNKKGVAIYFAILILSVIFGIGMGLSLIIFNQIKTVREVGNSVFAFLAADSGIEEAMYRLYKRGEISFTIEGSLDFASYIVKSFPAAAGSNDCSKPPYNYFCLKAEGRYKETKRALDVSF